MNQFIRALAREAGFDDHYEDHKFRVTKWGRSISTELSTFAQIVAHECAVICDILEAQSDTTTPEDCARCIRTKFEIKKGEYL